MKRTLFILLLNFLFFFPVKGDVNIKGYFQNWFSMTSIQEEGGNTTAYGFSNRRIRLTPYGNFGERIKWGAQFAYDKMAVPTVLDLWIEYVISPEAVLKFGKFASPGSRAGALTSSAALDLLERAAIVQIWGGNSGLHSYRAFGAQLSGKLARGRVYYALMLANALTASNNWLPSVKSVSDENPNNGFGYWGRVEVSPVSGLDIGGFIGFSSEADPLITGSQIEKNSFGGHVFYKKDKLNLKLEYIQGEAGDKKYSGFYSVAGYRLNKFEPIIGFDRLKPLENGEAYSHTTAGLNYYHSPEIRLQLNYVFRTESVKRVVNNILYVNVQYSFDTRKK